MIVNEIPAVTHKTSAVSTLFYFIFNFCPLSPKLNSIQNESHTNLIRHHPFSKGGFFGCWPVVMATTRGGDAGVELRNRRSR